MVTDKAMIKARTTIQTSRDAVRQWFLDLKQHPERYQFDTHAGFEILEGDFAEVGARFCTHEKFYGLRMTLYFVLTDVGEYHFQFQLRRPIKAIWGTFSMERDTENTTILHLDVGGATQLKQIFLKLPLVHQAIQRQIQREVQHVKASVEEIYTT